MAPAATGRRSESERTNGPDENFNEEVEPFDIISEDDIETARRTLPPVVQRRASFGSLSRLAALIRGRLDGTNSGAVSAEKRHHQAEDTLSRSSKSWDRERDDEPHISEAVTTCDAVSRSAGSSPQPYPDTDDDAPTALHMGEDFEQGYLTGKIKVHVSFDYYHDRLKLALMKLSNLHLREEERNRRTECVVQAVLLPDRSDDDCCQSVSRFLDESCEAAFDQLLDWSDLTSYQIGQSYIEISAWNAHTTTLIGVVKLPLSFLQNEEGLRQRNAVCHLHRREDIDDSAQVRSTPTKVQSTPTSTVDGRRAALAKRVRPREGSNSNAVPRRIVSCFADCLLDIVPLNPGETESDCAFLDLLQRSDKTERHSPLGDRWSRRCRSEPYSQPLKPVERPISLCSLLTKPRILLSSVTPLRTFASPNEEDFCLNFYTLMPEDDDQLRRPVCAENCKVGDRDGTSANAQKEKSCPPVHDRKSTELDSLAVACSVEESASEPSSDDVSEDRPAGISERARSLTCESQRVKPVPFESSQESKWSTGNTNRSPSKFSRPKLPGHINTMFSGSHKTEKRSKSPNPQGNCTALARPLGEQMEGRAPTASL